jgi:hypothetical protein
MKKFLIVSACALASLAIPFAASASADITPRPGHGLCFGFPPGGFFSAEAQAPGPNAGPNNISTPWDVAPGTPSTPGQGMKSECHF